MNELPTLSIVDVVALAFVVLNAIVGLVRKLSGELAQLVAAVAALVLGVTLHRPFGDWILANTGLEAGGARAAAFLLTVLTAVVCMLLMRAILRHAMKVVFDPVIDRIGGLVAGALRGAVIVAILFILMNIWPQPYLNRVFGKESTIGTLVVRYLPYVRATVRNQLDHLRTDEDGGKETGTARDANKNEQNDFNRPQWLR